MFRSVLALVVSWMMVFGALAKDLCIQLDDGLLSGSHLALKKVKLGPGNVGPLQGYLAKYSITFSYFAFTPIHGQSVVSSLGNAALAMSVHDVEVLTSGGLGFGSAATYPVNLACSAGSDRKLSLLDSCSGKAVGDDVSAHVIECSDVAAIP